MANADNVTCCTATNDECSRSSSIRAERQCPKRPGWLAQRLHVADHQHFHQQNSFDCLSGATGRKWAQVSLWRKHHKADTSSRPQHAEPKHEHLCEQSVEAHSPAKNLHSARCAFDFGVMHNVVPMSIPSITPPQFLSCIHTHPLSLSHSLSLPYTHTRTLAFPHTHIILLHTQTLLYPSTKRR